MIDLIEIRKELCAHYELHARNLSQYAEKYLKVRTVAPLFSDIAEKYDGNSSITLTLNTKNATQA
jgi:cytochrome c551/c552